MFICLFHNWENSFELSTNESLYVNIVCISVQLRYIQAFAVLPIRLPSLSMSVNGHAEKEKDETRSDKYIETYCEEVDSK